MSARRSIGDCGGRGCTRNVVDSTHGSRTVAHTRITANRMDDG
jgi:hypothetical protein